MPYAKAVVAGRTIAETDDYEVVEGNVYFPPSSVDASVLSKTNTHSICPWKGEASYYSITLDKTELKDAAWYYPEPKEKAKKIKDYVAFYYGDGHKRVSVRHTQKNALEVTGYLKGVGAGGTALS